MYCSHCGSLLSPQDKKCYSCGNEVNFNDNDNQNNKKSNYKKLIIGSVILSLIVIMIYTVSSVTTNYYFYNQDYHQDDQTIIETNENDVINNQEEVPIAYDTLRSIPQTTTVNATNRYEGIIVKSKGDALRLIKDDSKNQKANCPKDIIQLESRLANDFFITGVNLCEISPDMAEGIYDVIEKIYDEYPEVRGYLTNLTVLNLNNPNEYIAAFMPAFFFINPGTINSPREGYPTVNKTQMLLNTYYFFNEPRLKVAMSSSSQLGHFPPNSNVYSPIAHEMGHYISFISLLKYYKMDSVLVIDKNNVLAFSNLYNTFRNSTYSYELLLEAYERDLSKGSLTFDAWRGTISNYALARNRNGGYIYDETIAEAFHDCFLNGNNAKNASKMIVKVLKEKLR